jgi:hypothetical protein
MWFFYILYGEELNIPNPYLPELKLFSRIADFEVLTFFNCNLENRMFISLYVLPFWMKGFVQ